MPQSLKRFSRSIEKRFDIFVGYPTFYNDYFCNWKHFCKFQPFYLKGFMVYISANANTIRQVDWHI